MKQLLLLLSLIILTFNSFASEINCKEVTEYFDHYGQTEQQTHAKICHDEYILKIKDAIKLVKKNKRTACSFKELQLEIDLFKLYVLDKVATKKLSTERFEDMKDFYLELYGHDQATKDCDSEQTAEFFFDSYVLENTELLIDEQV
jgi:hypothetical protein